MRPWLFAPPGRWYRAGIRFERIEAYFISFFGPLARFQSMSAGHGIALIGLLSDKTKNRSKDLVSFLRISELLLMPGIPPIMAAT